MALLIAALLLFVAFHFLPAFPGPFPGWEIWPQTWSLLVDLLRHTEGLGPDGFILLSSFLTLSLLIVVSPFLTNVWMKSRLAWWFAVSVGGLTSAGLWVVMLWPNSDRSLGLGGWCLMIAPLLNFAGLLLARGKMPNPATTTPLNEKKPG